MSLRIMRILICAAFMVSCFALTSCSKDKEEPTPPPTEQEEPSPSPTDQEDPTPSPTEPGNNNDSDPNSVIINEDGSTSTGVSFMSIVDNSKFSLDYIIYEISDSHLVIVGYDKYEIGENVKPYSTITYKGTKYNVRVIQVGAFQRCEHLKTIEIPETVSEIRSEAFCDCTNLTTVKLPDSLDLNGGFWDGRFRGCSSLEEIILPDKTQVIGSNDFAGCTSLKYIKFPKNLKTIRDGAKRPTDKEIALKLEKMGAIEKHGKTNAQYYILPRRYYELCGDLAAYSQKTDWDINQVWAILCPFLHKYGKAKRADINKLMGDHLSDKQLRKFIEELKEYGLIKTEGGQTRWTYMLGDNFIGMERALELGLAKLRLRLPEKAQ